MTSKGGIDTIITMRALATEACTLSMAQAGFPLRQDTLDQAKLPKADPSSGTGRENRSL